jgi:hypothetical protein
MVEFTDEIKEMILDKKNIMNYEDEAKKAAGLMMINEKIADAYSELLKKEKGEKEMTPTEMSNDMKYRYRTKEEIKIIDDINQHYQGNTFQGVKFDPYLVARIFNMKGGPLEHIMKKCLRGERKGHTEEQVLNEIICAAKRGLEIINIMDEDNE